jgi:uncharacterized protein YndB with AHSA1/START domain
LRKQKVERVKDINVEVWVQAPIGEVWDSWTQSDRITWFSPEANIEARLGGAYELFWDPANHDSMSTKGCRITAYEPMKLLAFIWKGPDQFAHFMNTEPPKTRVKVSFEDGGDRTKLAIEHTGWGKSEEWEEARTWHVNAWKGVLDSLVSRYE